MPLILDDRKLLLPGIHEASMQEVEEQFARFQKSDRRMMLFRKLHDYIAALRKAECGKTVILDGSFVMGCIDEPGDIDLILVMPADWDWDAELKPYQYNLISKRRVKKEYGFDIFVVPEGSADEQGWTEFFSKVNVKWCRQFGWATDSLKGIVKVTV